MPVIRVQNRTVPISEEQAKLLRELKVIRLCNGCSARGDVYHMIKQAPSQIRQRADQDLAAGVAY